MIVGRKLRREYWVSVALNGIPDLAIAGTAPLIFDGGFLMFIGVLFGLRALYFAIWLKNSAWIWIRYYLRDKKLVTRRLIDFLIENKFPKPDEYVFSAEEYLAEVAADETIDVKTRILAGRELGALGYLTSTMRAQEYMRISYPFEAAIEEYHRKISEVDYGSDGAPDEEDKNEDDNDEEAQLAMQVKTACQLAENPLTEFLETGDEYEQEIFEKFKGKAIEKTNLINDDFYHAFACHQLIRLFILEKNVIDAKQWFGRIREEDLKDKILEEFPEIEGD